MKTVSFFTSYLFKWPLNQLILDPTMTRQINLASPQNTDYYDYSEETMTFFDPYLKEEVSINMNVYKPKRLDDDVRVFLYFHGGGYVFLNPKNQMYHEIFDKVMKTENYGNYIIVAPEYRKAPEVKVRSILLDGLESVKWVKKQFGMRKLVMLGDSAGGNLALDVIQQIRDGKYEIYDKEKMFIGAMYPWVCLNEEKCPVKMEKKYVKNGLMVNADNMLYFTMQARDDYLDSQNLYKDVSNLPPHFISVAEHDVLRNQGVHFAKTLQKQNNKIHSFLEVKDECHGFFVNGENRFLFVLKLIEKVSKHFN